MKSRKFISIVMALLTLAAIVGGFSSFQRKRSSFERLDFQFHWRQGIVYVDAVTPEGGAAKAGLRAGDQIWVVNGVPTHEVDGLKKTIRQLGTAELLVARGDQTFTIRYAAPGVVIDYHYLFLSFIAFLYLAIGLFTFYRSPGSESTLFFLLTLLTFIVYIYTPAGDLDATFKALYLTEEAARILLPPLALHFFLRFPRPLLRKRGVIPALYAPPAILGLWVIDVLLFDNMVAFASTERSLLLIDRWEMLHIAAYFSAAFVALTYTYRTTAATGHKRQIQWIYLGMGVGFIPFLVLYLVPFILKGTGSAYTTIAILPLALIPLAFAVSILKYKLWDVEVVIKEGLAYTVTFLFGMIAFSAVNLLLSSIIEERLVMERNFLAFASGLLIAGVLVPMKSRVESLIEMFLYRDTYRHRKAMSQFVYELATFHDLTDLFESIRQRLEAALEVEKANLYFREGTELVLYTEESDLPPRISEEIFARRLSEGILVLDQPRLPDETTDISGSLLRAGYRYAFPLRFRNRLEGMLICGARKGEVQLSRDDIALISSLTAPVSLAIENARLYGRLRRQIEEIVSLKEYNENIIESSSSAIVVVGRDGTLLTANQAFWELAEIGADNQMTIERLFPPYNEVIQAPPRSAIEVPFTSHRGKERHLSVTAAPFRALDVPEGTGVLVITDISDRVRLERELQEKERLASLGLLAAGVAHEVNTPLTGISSYAQLLLAETDPDDPRYDLLRKMEQQTFRASHIVNNLLDFAANRSRANERVSLAEVISTTISLHEVLMRAKAVNVHVGEIPDAEVLGNFYELQQVLTNLLLNARDAVDHGGNVWIDVDRHDGEATLVVRDDGRGIPADLVADIFKPLVTGKRGQGGTGLGLAVSDRIVRGLGGVISVDSEEGKGAEFRVRIPVLQESLAGEADRVEL
jgi:signal transduction histidine kinase